MSHNLLDRADLPAISNTPGMVLLPALAWFASGRYRAEYLLGFVLGMTFVFGAMLPTLIGSVVATVSAVVKRRIRPLLVRLWNRLNGPRSVTA